MINSIVDFVMVALEGNGIFGDLLDKTVDLGAFLKPGAYIFSYRHYKWFVRITTL